MAKKVPVNDVIKMTKQGYTDADIIKYLRGEGYSSTEINDAVNQAKVKLELARTAGIEEYGLGGIEGEAGEELEEAPMPSMPGEYEEAVPEQPQEIIEEEGAMPGEEMMPSIMEQEEVPAEETYAPEVPMPEETYAPAPSEAGYAEYPYEAAAAAVPAGTEAIEELTEELINEKLEEFKTKIGNVSELKSHFESKLKQVETRMKKVEMSLDKIHLGVVEQVKQYGHKIDDLKTEIEILQNTFSQILQPLISSAKELREVSEEVKKKKVKTPATKAKIAKLKKIAAKAETIKRKKK